MDDATGDTATDDPSTGDAVATVRTRPAPAVPDDAGEATLVARLRAGDEGAFLTLIRRHQASMLRLARTYVSSQATAEDVVQETWLAVLRGVDRFDGRSSCKTWLYRILINRAKTAGQRDRRYVPDSWCQPYEGHGSEPAVTADRFLDASHPEWPRRWDQPPLAWERSVEDRLVTSEAVGVVAAAINDLTTAQRLVVSLRDVECWTAQEVCDVLGLAATNQRVILHRGRANVRRRLESYFGSADEDERRGPRGLVLPGAGGTGHRVPGGCPPG